MEQKVLINNFRRFNDDVEGKRYNFTKVSMQMPISSKNENSFGVDSVEANIGDSTVFDKYVSMRGKLPAYAMVDLEVTTKGIDVLSLTFITAPAKP